MNEPRSLWRGDPVPTFVCNSTSNPTYRFDTVGGRYVVMFFFGTAALDSNRAVLDFITKDLRRHFNDDHAAFFGVSIDPQDQAQQRVKEEMPGIRYF